MNEQVRTEGLGQETTLPATRISFREIALSDPSGGVVQLMPKNFGEVVAFSELMSRSACAVRPHLRNNPGACMAVALQAMRWQMDPFAVANKTYFVNDQLAFEAQLIGAVITARAPIKSRPEYRYEGDGLTLKCFCKVTTLDGKVIEHESPMVRDIKVKNSPLWTSDPKQQLGYYTLRAMSRLHFPDVILGAYDRDEIVEAEPMRVVDDRSAGESLAVRLEQHAADRNKSEPPHKFDQTFVERELSTTQDMTTGIIRDTSSPKTIEAEPERQGSNWNEQLDAYNEAARVAADREEVNTGPTVAEMQEDHQALVDEEDEDEPLDDYDATLAGFETKVCAFDNLDKLNEWGDVESKADWYVNAPDHIRQRAMYLFGERVKELKKAAKKTSAAKADKAQQEPKAEALAKEEAPAADPVPAAVLAEGEKAAAAGFRRFKLWRAGLQNKDKAASDAFLASPHNARLEKVAKQADEAL